MSAPIDGHDLANLIAGAAARAEGREPCTLGFDCRAIVHDDGCFGPAAEVAAAEEASPAAADEERQA